MAEDQEMLEQEASETTEEESTEQEEQVEEQTEESTSSEEDEYTDEDISNLSDEEFDKWLETGEYPKERTKPKEEKKKEQVEEEKQEEKKPKDKKDKESEIDYKEAYERIFKPFKANGTEITPRSIEDIVSLMQQGANYTKKMQDLAPLRKIAESVVRANIDNERLSYLIDLHRGDKKAIKKLLKDNNIDLADFDPDEESDYQSNSFNIASDGDVDFQDAILESKENLEKIRTILNDTWDNKSKEEILSNPTLLKALNWEISSGRFDQVQKIVESEKTFGRSNGRTDLQMYADIARAMEQYYATQHQSKSESTSKTRRQTNKPVPKAADKTKAAPSKGKPTPTKSGLTPEQIMSMPEEEFRKLNIKDIM